MLDIVGAQRFHGHMCPGLAVGIRAAEVALREVGAHSADEEVVAVVETDMCGVDAVQYLTGCTFGKGNLIHLDYGKSAFTFMRRSDNKAIRIITRPDAWGEPNPEHQQLFALVRSGHATADERTRFQALHQQRSQTILDAPLEQLFIVQAVEPRLPLKAHMRNSVPCDECGESTMETRTRRLSGRTLCIPCFEKFERRL